MKKIILIFISAIVLSTFANAQQKSAFTFVKSSIIFLEKRASVNNDGMDGHLFSTPILKKRMLGMFLVEDITSPIDYNSDKYIKFSAIAVTEKFEMITDSEYGKNDNWEENLFIQNVKTKQKYAVMVFPMRKFQDYNNSSNELNGNGWLTKYCPKELSQEDKVLVAKYKALIKSADVNMTTLKSIQKKYMTRGYFDSERVNSIDKKSYNKNLKELKEKGKKLSDIREYEDKKHIIEGRLTISELGSLSSINDWMGNQFELN